MKLNKLSIEDVTLTSKNILIRVDFNVPMDGTHITNDQRIRAALPTLQHCLSKNPKKVILMSHLGRPNGLVNKKYSLLPVCQTLSELLKTDVRLVENWLDEDAEKTLSLKENVVLLENLRFHIAEEGSSKDQSGSKTKATQEQLTQFRSKLSKFADVYVNDAFGTAHRAHSSMVGVDCKDRVCGLLMKQELEYFSKVLENPNRPLLAILGGAKIADKIPLIENLLDKVDSLIIGGGMAFTFKKVLENMEIGDSLFDEHGAEIVHKLMDKAKQKNVKIILPVDFVIADKFDKNANIETASDSQGIKKGWMGLDCGPQSSKLFEEVILGSKTILWNGPAGVFEFDRFSTGTKNILDAVVAATKDNNALSIVGGGDTATAVAKFNKESFISHVSTGGGASLELLEGKDLPGVIALSDKN